MRYLLDTHVILWMAFEDTKISKKVRDILVSGNNEIFISAVSLWEISLKYHSGKLDLKEHNPETLMAGFDEFFECHKLDLHVSDAVSLFKLDKIFHKDPFDRMLIWQALKHKFVLISDDEMIKLYSDVGLKVLW